MHIAAVAVIILAAIILVVIDHKRAEQKVKTVAADATNAIASVDHDAVAIVDDTVKEVEKI